MSINGKNRNINKMFLSELLFGTLYFENSFSDIEESVVEIYGVSSESIELFFDFIQNRDRFTNPHKFIKSYDKTEDQFLYELLIIFDYFNSSLLSLVCEILKNKLTQEANINQIDIYEHINSIYYEIKPPKYNHCILSKEFMENFQLNWKQISNQILNGDIIEEF